jgi:hypothetical protein
VWCIRQVLYLGRLRRATLWSLASLAVARPARPYLPRILDHHLGITLSYFQFRPGRPSYAFPISAGPAELRFSNFGRAGRATLGTLGSILDVKGLTGGTNKDIAIRICTKTLAESRKHRQERVHFDEDCA